MKYEKTQKGNPYQLTVDQHIFPKASIYRFVGDDGRVELRLLGRNKTIRATPENKVFCAHRTWDQRAEAGYMKEIEDKFQELAERIISDRHSVSKEEQAVVSEFFSLWNIRAHRNRAPIRDQIVTKGEPLRKYTKDEEEELEKNHISVIRHDGTMSGRHSNAASIQINLIEVRWQLADAQWGVLRAKAGEFMVPDNFSNARIVPLTPKICLSSQSIDEEIEMKEVAEINTLVRKSAKNYLFARKWANCPFQQELNKANEVDG